MKSKQTYNRNHCTSPARIIDGGLIEIARCVALKQIGLKEYKNAREEDSILKNVPSETNFFYNIIKYNEKGQTSYTEKGIGELEKNDGRTILIRKHVFKIFTSELMHEFVPRKPKPKELTFDGWFVVMTSMPDHYSQLMVTPHSVLCSIDPQTPTTVPLEEGTLLGRLDGRIQSIDSDELIFILGYKLKRAVEASRGNLDLSAKQLSLNGTNSIIMTDQIQLRPKKQRPRRFSVGSLYYNEKKKTYEFHDGEKWRTLVAE